MPDFLSEDFKRFSIHSSFSPPLNTKRSEFMIEIISFGDGSKLCESAPGFKRIFTFECSPTICLTRSY